MKGETVRLRKQRDQKKGGHQKIIINTSQLEKQKDIAEMESTR